MNPYEILGVRQDATPDEVKAAFRVLASKSHPDKGGREETMAAVNDAYAVLSDPARRALYDEMGVTEELTPVELRATQALASIFARALEQEQFTPVDWATRQAKFAHAELKKERDKLCAQLARARSQQGKVIVTKEGQPNLVETILAERIELLTKRIRAVSDDIDTATLACELVQNYTEAGMPPARRTLLMRAGFPDGMIGPGTGTTTW